MNPSLEHHPPPPTAAQRALAIPELLTQILTTISLPDNHTSHLTLTRCARVSPLWHTTTLPLLWRHPCRYPEDNLHKRLLAIRDADPEQQAHRRQAHADLIQETCLVTLDGEEASVADRVLAGVVFPRLERVRVWLVADCARVPFVRGGMVGDVELDSSFDGFPDTNKPSRGELGEILGQIPVS